MQSQGCQNFFYLHVNTNTQKIGGKCQRETFGVRVIEVMGFTYQLFFHLCVFIELQVGWDLENIQLSSVCSLLEITFFSAGD